MPTKRHFAILAAAALTIVACTPATAPAPAPGPTTEPAPGTMPETRTGGPCGDGTILHPGEHCP